MHKLLGILQRFYLGDPSYPLLFVIYIEYLSRLLNYEAQKPKFDFHQRRGSFKLNNLCFVDDLLLFDKGDIPYFLRAITTW